MKKLILFVSSYPPRECGIATFTKDLVDAIKKRFTHQIEMKVCALEEGVSSFQYDEDVVYRLDTTKREHYARIAEKINNNRQISALMIEHEFGLFGGKYGEYLLDFLEKLKKPVVITFHTVLPKPHPKLLSVVTSLANSCRNIIVMTHSSGKVLEEDYGVPPEKIRLIPHGTHLTLWREHSEIKKQFGIDHHLILSTFGLLGPNKSIETALYALPGIVKEFPSVLYLILGQTHPGIIKHEGEKYRTFLETKVHELKLDKYVRFINKYLSLEELLDYLLATDIYLFTSKDRQQAVSGTFIYAMSCACPIVATAIPHAKEMLTDDTGILVDFEKPEQITHAVLHLLKKWSLREEMSIRALMKTRDSTWENVSLKTVQLYEHVIPHLHLFYRYPEINMLHIKNMTSEIGIIQFARIDVPDIVSGYTLDDNARALIALTMHYIQFGEKQDLPLMDTYLNFMGRCQRTNGRFVNYIDRNNRIHIRNNAENMDDCNGRAIWALGYFISHKDKLENKYVEKAQQMFEKVWHVIDEFISPRAMAFIIKGLYFYYQANEDREIANKISSLSDSLLNFYNEISDKNWQWFEEYLTYANATLPESMLYAWKVTGNVTYRIVAKSTFDFLLSTLFKNEQLYVISNSIWFKKSGGTTKLFGQQPVDVSYINMTLDLFYREMQEEKYKNYLLVAFSWYLGNNILDQMVYNPKTGGCYDGIGKEGVNLNQGAESTITYLISRLIMEAYPPQAEIADHEEKL